MASRLTSNLPPSATPPNAPLTHVEPQNRPTVALTTLSSETSQTQSNASMTAVRPDLQKEVDTIKSMAGGVLHVLVKQDQEIKEQRRENQQLQQKVLDLENQNKEKNSLISQTRNEQIKLEKDILRIAIFSEGLFSSKTAVGWPFSALFRISVPANMLSAIQDEPISAELLEYMEKNPGITREEGLRALLIVKLKRAGENSYFPTENDIQSAIQQTPPLIGTVCSREQAMRTLVNQHIERLKEKTGKKD